MQSMKIMYAMFNGYNIVKYGGPQIDLFMYINSAMTWGETHRMLIVGRALNNNFESGQLQATL